MMQDNTRHADEVYNRALVRLYRAAISAALRAEGAEEAEQSKDAAPTCREEATSSSEGFEITRSANQSPQ
jgi:hypothetical protein